MKKFLIVSGAIFWILVVIGIATFVFIIQEGRKLDVSSKAFVDKNIPPIISTWSKSELIKYASPEAAANFSNEEADKDWVRFTKLGALEKYDGAKGQCYMSFIGPKGRGVTAAYKAEANFQNGNAEITVDLTRKNGEWQIYSFWIDSPFFVKN